MKLQLVGGDYAARSPASQAESCVNLYPELVDGVTARGPLNPNAQGKSAGSLYGTPGRVQFAALGHTNIRAQLSVNGRVWVVNGSDLVELSNVGAVLSRHAIPGSSGSGVASLAFNGRQILVVDNGIVACDDGSSCVAVSWPASTGTVNTLALTGTCNTVGTAVTWTGGINFNLGALIVGTTITINAVPYTIATVTSYTTLTLTSSAGTQSGVGFTLTPTEVDWVSGDQFVTDGTWTGTSIVVNGTSYTILEVLTPILLYVSPFAGTQLAVSYSKAGAAVTGIGPAVFLDGYFIVQRPSGGSPNLGRQFNVSNLNDGSTWDPLSFGVKESYPDNIVSLLAANEQLYVFGSESLEVWQNTGGTTDDPFPFSRIPGSVSRFGAVSPWTQIALDGNVYFLGGDGSGNVRAYVLNGWSPVPVSTPAEENAWLPNPGAGTGFGQGAIAYGYLEGGHSFWVVSNTNYGSPGQTWGYDQNTGAWHQRYSWTGSAFAFNHAEFHCFAYDTAGDWGAGIHLVSDRSTGTIYISSINYFIDAVGATGQIKWQRTLPYIYQGNQRFIYGRVTLEMETGGITSGSAPVVTLDWSDDRGQTFRGNLSASIGAAGQTNVRVYWTRTGGLSGNGGMSRGRIYRISGVLPFTPSNGYRVALIDMDVDLAVCA